MKQRLHVSILAALAGLLLAACGSLGGPRTITLSEADLLRALARQLPLESRFLDLLDVQVGSARLKTLPEANRLSTEMDLTATERLSGRSFAGRIGADFGLRHDAAGQAIRLTDVRVRSLELDGLPAAWRPQLGRLGALVAEQLLEDLPVYRFKPEDLQRAAALGLRPGTVNVTPRGVEILLAPLP